MASSHAPLSPNSGPNTSPAAPADSSIAEATTLAEILQRLTVIEQNQTRLSEELLSVKAYVYKPAIDGVNGHVNGSGKERAGEITAEGETEPVDLGKSLEELTKKVDGLATTVKLDQQRLYARLMNSRIREKKELVKPVMAVNGKPPPNFPGTKGEFEHVTKERYEEYMKSYGIPLKGDTNTKRQAVREFLGLPPAQ